MNLTAQEMEMGEEGEGTERDEAKAQLPEKKGV